MTTLEQLRARREEILKLAAKRRIEDIRVFGSVIRGEDGPDSDIDMLVRALPGCSLMGLGGFKMEMEALFGRKVDVLTDRGISHLIRDRVMEEARPL